MITVAAHEGSSAGTALGTVAVGAISSKGAQGGSVAIYTGSPTAQTVSVTDGTMTGSFAPSALSVDNMVNQTTLKAGAISAIGTAGNGGFIDLQTHGALQVGTMDVSSTGGNGADGQISTIAPAQAVKGSLLANGSGAGAGGSVAARANRFSVTGTILANGGVDGSGGSISLLSGTVQVQGTARGASISAADGTAFGGSSAASVAVTTGRAQSVLGLDAGPYQPVPPSLLLTSTLLTETALPGGRFTVGSASTNGTAGSIVAGTTIQPVQTPPLTAPTSGMIQIAPSHGLATIILNGSTPATIQAGQNITPAVVLAIYDQQLAGGQMFGLSGFPLSAESATVRGSNSDIVRIIACDVPQQITKAGIFAGSGKVVLDIIGSRSFFTCPAVSFANSTLRFDTISAGAVIEAIVDARGQSLALPAASAITADGWLTLTGSASVWHITGTVMANTLQLSHAAGTSLTVDLTNGALFADMLLFADKGGAITVNHGQLLPLLAAVSTLGSNDLPGRLTSMRIRDVDLPSGINLMHANAGSAIDLAFRAGTVQISADPQGSGLTAGTFVAIQTDNASIDVAAGAQITAGRIKLVSLADAGINGNLTSAGSLSAVAGRIELQADGTSDTAVHIAGGDLTASSIVLQATNGGFLAGSSQIQASRSFKLDGYSKLIFDNGANVQGGSIVIEPSTPGGAGSQLPGQFVEFLGGSTIAAGRIGLSVHGDDHITVFSGSTLKAGEAKVAISGAITDTRAAIAKFEHRFVEQRQDRHN
jgi:hypothetical protein